MKEAEKKQICDRIAGNLAKGIKSDQDAEDFWRLIRANQEVEQKSTPHFGNAPLPDDDW